MSRVRAAHSKQGYPEAFISIETQTFSSLVSAPMCGHRAENKSVTEKAAPWITRPEATRNTFRVLIPSLLRRKCWQISSSGPLHPKATLDSFDLQTALSSAICGFLCTLTPPAWIYPKNIPPPKHTSFCLLLPTLLPVELYTALLCGLCVSQADFPHLRNLSSEGYLNKWGCYSPPTLSPYLSSESWPLWRAKSLSLDCRALEGSLS